MQKTKPVLVSSFCWVLNVYVWTRMCVQRQANTVSYSLLCQNVLEFPLNNSRKSTILSFWFFSCFFRHVLVAVLFCSFFQKEHLKAFHGLHSALYLVHETKAKREEIPASPMKGNFLPSLRPLIESAGTRQAWMSQT